MHALRRVSVGCAASALVMMAPNPAHAVDPVTKPKTEITLVPLAGGSSDLGIGGGVLGSFSRLVPGVLPYLWKLDLATVTMFDKPADLGARLTYEEAYADLVLPHLIPNRLRLQVRPSFTREATDKYSGLGNASPAPSRGADAEKSEYGRTHPALTVRTRLTLGEGFFLEMGARYTQNWIQVREGSTLDRDLRAGSPTVRSALAGTQAHGSLLFDYAVLYDTRDDETAPSRGQFHQIKVRLAPAGGVSLLPHRFAQTNATARGYVSIVKKWLTLAGRVVADVQFGDVPFYELSRYEDSFAIGGIEGVRGVPAQRYYGKVKLFGNLETRSDLFDFRFLGKQMTFGVATFFDAGRVWFDLSSHPELDGSNIGLKYGTGGGIRLRSGRSFVIRADLAYSPDASPVSGYFGANHIF
jgi:outer membrane protein assembly factor BamA